MTENITIVSVYFKMNVIMWHAAGVLDYLRKRLSPLLCAGWFAADCIVSAWWSSC